MLRRGIGGWRTLVKLLVFTLQRRNEEVAAWFSWSAVRSDAKQIALHFSV